MSQSFEFTIYACLFVCLNTSCCIDVTIDCHLSVLVPCVMCFQSLEVLRIHGKFRISVVNLFSSGISCIRKLQYFYPNTALENRYDICGVHSPQVAGMT